MSKGQRKTRSARVHKDFHEYNEDTALVLLTRAGATSAEQAEQELLQVHGIILKAASIEVYTRRFPEKYQDYRDKLAKRLEAKAAADGREKINLAQEIIGLCGEEVKREIELGGIRDPSKVAEQWANVASKQKDVVLGLEARPSKVVEHRGLPEIYARLEALGVAEVIDADAETIEDVPQLAAAKE